MSRCNSEPVLRYLSKHSAEPYDALVVAHVIPAPGFAEEAFRAWCREALGKRSEPDIVRLHADFPRTGSGRVIARDLT